MNMHVEVGKNVNIDRKNEIYDRSPRDSDYVGIYVIYDEKGKRFDIPFFALNDIFAKRRFEMMALKPDTMLNQFTNDYKLYRIGEFGIIDGTIDAYEADLLMSGNQINKGDR